MDYGENTTERFHNMTQLHAEVARPSNASIGLLARMLTKVPSYTPDERALLILIAEKATVVNDSLAIFNRHNDAFHQLCAKIQADTEAAIKNAPNRRDELSSERLAQIKIEGERFHLQVVKDTAEPSVRLKQVDAALKAIVEKLQAQEKAGSK
jgi:hypothetical protein